MPTATLLAPTDIDQNQTVFDIDAIRERNPQRFDLEMLDRIVHLDPDSGLIAAVREIRQDEFWVRCHFPDEAILPGVLMIEAAGQLCSFYFREVTGVPGVIGFAATDRVKFRGLVRPGERLLIVGQMTSLTARRARFKAQAFVGERRVFEAEVTGMVVL